jgi:hypothetical protein
MPATTPKGYPYPLGTDRVMDGDDSIQALASAVDTKVGLFASGYVASPVPGSLNTPVSVAVTFPAGLFSANPVNVTVTPLTATPQARAVSVNGVSQTGAQLWVSQLSGTLAATTLYWHASQVVP